MTTPHQAAILEALEQFYCLTPHQILGLGIYSDRGSLYDALKVLSRRGLIHGTEPLPKPGAGRVPGVYSLTAAGAEFLGEGERTPPVLHRRGNMPPHDVEHRIAIVDVHLALDAWAETVGHQLRRFTPDFAPSGQRGQRATAIRLTESTFYVPDALAFLSCQDGNNRPLVVEVYRGGFHGRPEYIRRKIPEVLDMFLRQDVHKAIRTAEPGEWTVPRLLVVTDTGELRDAVLRTSPAQNHLGWNYVFLKSLDELGPDFLGGWWRLGGKRESLF